MAELREYHVTVNGHDTVMNLTAEEAERLGGKPVDGSGEKQRDTAPNKSRTVRNKSND